MSILIKGMEMPITCEDCNLESFCDLWVDARRMNNGNRAECRHSDCPLVEIPLHGRLIDADALKPKFIHGRWDDTYISSLDLSHALTIIEAEEKKHDQA